MRPQPQDHPDYYRQYVSLVKQEDVMSALDENRKMFLAFLHSIDPALENYAYAPGKWTVKQVILHCSDTERIFSTRALGYARGERQKSLPFDENAYAAAADTSLRSLKDIAWEYEAVANSTAALFRSFSPEQLSAKGETPTGLATVNAMGFCICGHNLHHLNVITERYLNKISNSK